MIKSVTLKSIMSQEKMILNTASPDYSNLPEVVIHIGKLFLESGYEISLVGGSVRDLYLKRDSPDLDFTTNAKPDEIISVIKTWATAYWDIGKSFGTIGFTKDNFSFEVTTYRLEKYSEQSRNPEVSYGTSLLGDLARRDFTINALALELPNMKLCDPHNGIFDIQNKILRTPGSATQSFTDDPLRMMRAARFVAQLDLKVDPEILLAMKQMAERITIISAERIRDELVKLILAKNPVAGIEILVSTGIAEYVLPEISKLFLQIDEHRRHKDVYQHTLQVLNQAIELETGTEGHVPTPDFILRFAALLHDIGKPATRKFEPGGIVSFYHHDIVGARMATKRMRALKFDKETTKSVARLIELHLRFYGYGDAKWTDSAIRRYIVDAGDLLQRLHRLTRSDVTTRNKNKAKKLTMAYDDLELRIEQLQKREKLEALRPGLDGEQIMRILNLPPGPTVGKAYKFLLQIRIDEGPLDEKIVTERLLVWAKKELE